jgi:hypothetical protein
MAPMADTANSAILPFPSIHTSSPTKHPRRLSVVCHWCVGDSRARLSIGRRLLYRTWMGASISRITHRTNHRPKQIFSLRVCSGRRQHMEFPPASSSQRPASFSGAFSHGRTRLHHYRRVPQYCGILEATRPRPSGSNPSRVYTVRLRSVTRER